MIFFQSNTSNAGGKGKKKKEIDPTLLKARVMRETRNIPNLIAKLETFMGNLQKLASKGGLISEKFSLRLKSPKMGAKSLSHSRSKQRTDQRVLVLTLKFLALKKLVFPIKILSKFLIFFYLYSMQLNSADPKIFSKNF